MLEIVPLTTEDAADLSATAIRAYNDHYTHLWHDAGAWYVERSFGVAALQRELGEAGNLFFLAKYKGESIGFLKLRPDNQLAGQTGDGFEIERIYLMKKAVGKGVGAELMNFSVVLAVEREKDYVWLKAMDTSADAIRFYEKLGFRICAESRLTFEMMKNEFKGMVAMRRDL